MSALGSSQVLPPAPATRRSWWWYVVLFAAAFGLRLVHVLEARALPFFDSLINDAASYDLWARQIAAGDWLGAEVFYQAPLYPYWLGAVYSALGRDLFGLRVVQALVGAAGCVVLALAGRRFFDRRTGLIAGFMLALYPPAIFFDGLIQKAVLDGVLGALLLLGLARAESRPSGTSFAFVGLTLGLYCLSRENVLLVVPLVLAWGLVRFARAHSFARRSAWTGLLAAGVLAVLLPVIARNRYVGGEWTLSTPQAGVNFWIGNRAGASGSYDALRPGRGDTRHEWRDIEELAERAVGHALTPAEASAHWFGLARADIAADPMGWVALLGRKLVFALNRYEAPDTEDLYFYARSCRLIRWVGRVWHLGVLLPLAVLGAVVTWRRRSELSSLYLVFGGLLASVVVFFVFARYRYPLVPVLVLFAAAGVAALTGARAQRRELFGMRAGLALALLAGVVANWPIHARASQFAASFNNAGVALAQRGDLAGALGSFDEALRIQPGYFGAHASRGATLTKLGRHDEAEAEFRRAAELAPDDPGPLTQLGVTALLRGDAERARGAFEQVLARWPDAPEALNGMGHILIWRREAGAGLVLIRRAAELAPRDVRLSRDLAVMLCALPDASLRDGPAALEIARRLVRQTVNEDAESLDALGLAFGECGRFEEAQEAAQRALAVAEAAGRKDLAQVIRSRLPLYAAGKPSRFAPW